MKGLPFFSRLAFICNILFVVCLVMQRTRDFINKHEVSNIIITLGWFVGPLLNLCVNAWYLALVVNKRQLNLSRWLILINLLFLFLQFFIFFILPS